MRIVLRPKATRDRASSAGFTLVELLVVLAIIVIVSAFLLPGVSGMMQAYQLSTTGQTVINQLVLARQSALSGSHAVQVRFYYLPDYNASPASTAPPAVYRGMQSFMEDNPTAAGVSITPLIKPYFFAAPIIISNSTTVSPMIGTTPQTPVATDPALPGCGMNYKYVSFRFKPDGSTDLTTGANSITLVLENQKAGVSGLPANFQTLQIDPNLGVVRGFRP